MYVVIWMRSVADKMAKLPELVDLNGQKQFRIIPSHFPPINFFENIVDPSEMEMLFEIESLTNDRLRQEAGDIFLVSPKDWVSGVGSSIVMAAFTHIHKPSRFSDGSYGVYYASLAPETAIRETVYHRENFFRATAEEAAEITMRVYEGKIKKPLHDITGTSFANLHHPKNYALSQTFGEQLKKAESWGVFYHSVRHEGGFCVGALRPPAISTPVPVSHLKYLWNGEKITEVLEMKPISTFF